jgi:hypothetical protein
VDTLPAALRMRLLLHTTCLTADRNFLAMFTQE